MNPTTKPSDNLRRVLRGGSWNNNEPSWVRAASRNTLVPAYRSSRIGFRCALRGREPRV
jgi:formylglycine-generating enzyme required for sulfatase activity